ncbi:MAG: ribose-phosphate diphosphokinase [Desulfurococcaceae archaeon]
MIVGFPGYWLPAEIAGKIGAEEVRVTERSFPDGELYIRLVDYDKIPLRDVILVSTFFPEQDRKIWKTLLILDAIRNNNPKRIIAVRPYLAYSRQDRIFLPGEPVSACVVVKILRNLGVNILLTVDVHSNRVLECFGDGGYNIMVSDILVEHAMKYVDNPIIIAPDKGALDRVSHAARLLSLEHDYLVKQRDRITGEVTYMPRETCVKNRDVVIVDDIISTGGTIAEASKILTKQGARKIVVVAAHGLLAENAINKLESANVNRVILADTLLSRYDHSMLEYVDISGRIVRELSRFI